MGAVFLLNINDINLKIWKEPASICDVRFKLLDDRKKCIMGTACGRKPI
jgi:hypothetical protein